jgi:hypothetical protein
MAKRVQFKLDWKAITEMSRPMITEKVTQIASRCGPGYVGDVITTDRPHGAVRPTTFEAKRDNAKNNTLLKAVQGG